MALSQEEVQHIATLARIGLSEGDIEKYRKDLEAVLDWFETLRSVDTGEEGGIGHITGLSNIARSDRVSESDEDIRAGILTNVPETKDGFVKVKSVF